MKISKNLNRIKFFGKTKLSIFPVGFGAGDFFWNSNISEKDKIGLINYAASNGVNFFDTAQEYGNGESEKLIGKALKSDRERMFIATKFSPQNHNYKNVIKSCESSLKNLKTDYIDLYQIHWPNPSIALRKTLSALIELYNQGKIRAIGICNYGIEETKIISKFLDKIPLSSIQMEYNLFERTVEENGILNYCRKNKISFFSYSPLDQGQINNFSSKQKKLLLSIGKKHNKSIHQVMLNFIISKEQIIPIIRTTSINHLLENIKSVYFNLEESDLNEIEKIFPITYQHIPVSSIKISLNGEWNHKVYTTMEQAINNNLNFVPSPTDLSKSIKKYGSLKPVRLVKISEKDKKYDFELVAGRVRYWAWRIAFGDNCPPIPAYIRRNN